MAPRMNAETFDSVHPQLVVDHRHRVLPQHAAAAVRRLGIGVVFLLYQKGSPTVTPQYHAEIRQSRRRGLCDRAAVPGYGAPAWKSFSMRAFPFLSTNPWIVAFR